MNTNKFSVERGLFIRRKTLAAAIETSLELRHLLFVKKGSLGDGLGRGIVGE